VPSASKDSSSSPLRLEVMANPHFVGTDARSRMGAESSHLAMAEHPDQGDPIAKTFAQKDRARAGGTVAPVPSSARDLAASGLQDRFQDNAGQNRPVSELQSAVRAGHQARIAGRGESPEMTAVLGPKVHPYSSKFSNSGYGKGAQAWSAERRQAGADAYDKAEDRRMSAMTPEDTRRIINREKTQRDQRLAAALGPRKDKGEI